MQYERYPNELAHYGVKGMKWGVRKYRNSYGKRTQHVLGMYDDSMKKYNSSNAAYKKAKKSKAGRLAVKQAKSQRKTDFIRTKRYYKTLKYAAKADRGAERYMRGERIRDNDRLNSTLSSIGGAMAATGLAMSLAKEYPIRRMVDSAFGVKTGKIISNGLLAGGTGLLSVSLVKQAVDSKANSELQSYYGFKYKNIK